MLDNSDLEMGYSSVAEIFESRDVEEIKTAAEKFILACAFVKDTENGMLVYMLCRRLEESFAEWSKPYAAPTKTKTWQAVIVPPEHSHIMMLASCVPFGDTPIAIVAGMKRFKARADELTAPVFDAITPAEIKRVLTIAQKTYKLLDIIAPKEPLRILRFANSHILNNSQCGIPEDAGRPATLFIFHPKENSPYDRVFIFAHELGHALHLALTHNIDVLPAGFDEFNHRLGVRFESEFEKREAFADMVALAILNAKGLRTHFPSLWSKEASYSHAKYMRGLCTDVLTKAGKLPSPLPMPYSPLRNLA